MKKHLLIYVLLATMNGLLAQSDKFSKVYYNNTYGIKGNAIVTTSDKGYLIVGKNSYEPLIIKVDSTGSYVWSKQIGTANGDFNSIVATRDSNFVLTGYVSNFSSSRNDIVCVKITPAGDTLWTKTIAQFDDAYGTSVQQTYDDGYILCGYIMSPGAPYSDMVAVKLNSTGGLEWNKVITLGTAQNYAYSIKQAPDSTYVLNALIENYPPYDACDALIKLSSAGNIIWAKKYNQSTPVTTSPVDIEIVPSGIISFLSVSNSVAVMKTDFSGNVLWDKKYSIYSNPSGCMNCLKTKIHSTADGGYIVINGGQFSSYVAQIFRIDSTGNELWAKDVFFYGQDIALAGDKGYAILGNGPIYGVERSALGTYNDQIGLVKLDSLGNGISCLSSMGTSSSSANLIPTSISPTQTTGGSISALHPVIISTSLLVDPGCVAMLGNIDQNSATPITVSPNPSAGQFLFSGINAENTIEITDVLGKTIFRTTASHEQLELDISSKAKGIYFYRIRDKQKLLQQGKIVLQ